MKIIFRENIKIPFFFRNYKKFGSSNIKNIELINTYDDSFHDAFKYRECDSRADNISKKFIELFFAKKYFVYFEKWGGKKFARSYINVSFLREIRKIINEEEYVKSTLSMLELNDKTYYWPKTFSISLYNKLIKSKLIKPVARLHLITKIYLHSYEIAKYLYFFLKILFFIEIKLITFLQTKNLNQKKFKQCAILYDTLFDRPNNSTDIINSRIFKLIDCERTLLLNESDSKSAWVEMANSKGYNSVDLNNIFQYGSRLKYLLKYYLSDFYFKLELLSISFIHPYLIHSLFECYKSRTLWNMFYLIFQINICNRFMSPGLRSSNVVHHKNKTKTVFTYFSNTEPLVMKNYYSSPICYDYSYMNFDYLICSSLSKNFFELCENNVKEYICLGPVYADLIISARKNYKFVKNRCDIDINKKTISFFDNTIGCIGTQSFEEYCEFLSSMDTICKKYPNFNVIYKCKKNIKNVLESGGCLVKNLFSKVNKNTNFFDLSNNDLSSFEIIGVTDIVVGTPFSSVSYESLSSSTKTLIYDPFQKIKKLDNPSKHIPNLIANNTRELSNLISYWIYDVPKNDFVNYLEKQVESYIDIVDNDSADVSLIQKYKKLINNLN